MIMTNRVEKKIVLDFSTKFNQSTSRQYVTKTIAKKGEILGATQAMVQTRGRFFVENAVQRKNPNPELLKSYGIFAKKSEIPIPKNSWSFQKSLAGIPGS